MADPVNFRHTIPAGGAGQPLSSMCWHASYKMMLAWAKDDTTDIQARLTAAGLKWDELTARGLYREEFVRAGHALGFMGLGVDAIRRYTHADLADRLKLWGPFWTGIDPGGVGSPTHAVVTSGVDERLDRVYYMDPYKRPYDGDADAGCWTLKQFQKLLTDTPFCVQIWP